MKQETARYHASAGMMDTKARLAKLPALKTLTRRLRKKRLREFSEKIRTRDERGNYRISTSMLAAKSAQMLELNCETDFVARK